MSLSGPNNLFVIGDTDHWATALRHVDLLIDSRLRTVGRSNVAAGVGWASAFSAGSRKADAKKVYAELFIVGGGADPTATGFGVCAVGQESANLNWRPWVPGTFTAGAYNNQIMQNNVAAQSGLTLPTTAGNTVGLALYKSGSTIFVQFYSNGVPRGVPVAVTGAERFRLVCANYYAGARAVLRVDREELLYLPADAQPWGAAARVSDAGGYSPAATVFTRANAAITRDEFQCTARGTNATSTYAGSGLASSRVLRRELIYCEFAIEAAGATGPMVGLAPATATDTGNVGSAGRGWGYLANGARYFNGAATASAFTYGVGDNPGFVWDPLNGTLWLMRNGVAISGNPEAGTGAHYSGVTGTLCPAATPYSGGAVRLLAHARNQKFRPVYARAWDGADVLPEQHFIGHVLSETELRQSISFAMPWNTSRSGTPIGAIELANAGKRYHPLRTYNLRDQDIAVYDVVDGVALHAGRANVDNIVCNGARSATITPRGRDSRLDRRVESPAVSFGICAIAGSVPSETVPLAYTISQDPYFTVSEITDNGGSVIDFGRGKVGTNGIVRLVNPVGRHAALTFLKFDRTGETIPVNGDFDTWAGGLPTGWTVTHTPISSQISQSGAAARFQRSIGAPICRIQQALGAVFVQIEVSAYTSGDLLVGSAQNVAGIRGVGTYIVPGTLMLTAVEGTDLTVTSVRAISATSQASGAAAMRCLMETMGGFAANEWTFDNVALGAIGNLGYWSAAKPSNRQILDDVCRGMVWAYYTDPSGLLRIVPFSKPGAPVGRITRADIMSEVDVRDDLATGLTHACVAANRNYAVHSPNEIIPATPGSLRAALMRIGDIDRFYGLHPFYAAAVGKEIHPTPALADGGVSVGARLEQAYAERCSFYEMDVKFEAIRGHRLGQTLTVEHDAAPFAAESDLVLVDVLRRSRSSVARSIFWGRS